MFQDIDDDLPPAFHGLIDIRRLAGATLEVSFSLSERQVFVNAALDVVSELYVHLPLKRATRGIDPERRLRLLQLRVTDDLEEEQRGKQQAARVAAARAGVDALRRQRLEELGLHALLPPPRLGVVAGPSPRPLAGLGLDRLLQREEPPAAGVGLPMTDREFQDELLDVFASLRDLHTRYICPDPVRMYMAFLPLRIEECWERDAGGRFVRRYVVSDVADVGGFAALELEGAEVTHWNGVPIERAVERRAERSPGANPEARRTRGIEALTCRWLGTTPRPDEEWVIMTCRIGGRTRELRMPWFVGRLADPDEKDSSTAARSATVGLDPQSEMRRRAKYELFASEARTANDGSSASTARETPRFESIPTWEGNVGYLRIHTFAVRSVDAFIDTIKTGLADVPDRGLVIDVRGNPGGDILASERLLALLCAQGPHPQLLQFRVTPTTRRLAEGLGPQGGPRSGFVIDSIKRNLRSGEAYSRGSEIATIQAHDGPQYRGPIVLIVDALCYSATEVFAAGFQDNGRGLILGTAGCTGGGAGNSWGYDALQIFGGRDRFPLLPVDAAADRPKGRRGATFVVAVRRMTRAGSNQGETYEGPGILPDRSYKMTRADLLGRNEGLRAAAANLLLRGD